MWAAAVENFAPPKHAERRRDEFPLPEGEGQGEGERYTLRVPAKKLPAAANIAVLVCGKLRRTSRSALPSLGGAAAPP